ncbi:MAG: nucleotide exchange factor GrpE [Gammaproteobacteria bacterium RIFCSPHIGHO2_12_FULL_42_10]|nr:MAG: nucleotide exchange factor GrpE [Gammaproteobacteria bacterium RIFCSPHIGHO2_12_FULL_42_10]
MPNLHDQPHDDNDSDKKQGDMQSKHSEESLQALLTHPAYEELQKQLDEAEQTANQHWERILRMQAESENAKRRHEKDVASAHKFSLEKFVAELIPIIDSLELCVVNEIKDGGVTHSAVEGVQMTLNMFYTAMEKFGVKQVNPMDELFNPEFQQAISVREEKMMPAGTVLQVLQKGYTLNDRLIRPALVIVSK